MHASKYSFQVSGGRCFCGRRWQRSNSRGSTARECISLLGDPIYAEKDMRRKDTLQSFERQRIG